MQQFIHTKKELNFMGLGYQNFKFDTVSYSILVGSSQEVPLTFGLKHFVRLTVEWAMNLGRGFSHLGQTLVQPVGRAENQ